MACIVMAYIGIAYMVMAYILIAYVFMACIVVTYILPCNVIIGCGVSHSRTRPSRAQIRWGN